MPEQAQVHVRFAEWYGSVRLQKAHGISALLGTSSLHRKWMMPGSSSHSDILRHSSNNCLTRITTKAVLFNTLSLNVPFQAKFLHMICSCHSIRTKQHSGWRVPVVSMKLLEGGGKEGQKNVGLCSI